MSVVRYEGGVYSTSEDDVRDYEPLECPPRLLKRTVEVPSVCYVCGTPVVAQWVEHIGGDPAYKEMMLKSVRQSAICRPCEQESHDDYVAFERRVSSA